MAITTPLRIDLPPAYCPIPAEINDNFEECKRRGLSWMGEHGFCPDDAARLRVADTDSAEWCAQAMPHAGPERLQVATDWTYLMFVFDDLFCDTGESSTNTNAFVEAAARIMHLFEAPDGATMDAANPFTAPIRDLALRVRRCATPAQVRRWIEAHRTWLLGVAWQIAAQSSGTRLSLNDYTVMRLGTCGGLPCAAMVEEEEVPASELNGPKVRALTEAACLTAGWDNDLASYGKELWYAQQTSDARQGIATNLVDVLIDLHGYTRDQALQEATRMRDHTTHLFVRLREQVLPTASAPLRHYVNALGTSMRATVDVGVTTARYTNPDGAHPGAVHITSSLTDRPPVGAADPLPIPAIAWWWDLLDRGTV
ncbi:hypothetical protein FHS43_001585 [Streptosporangium becharense]|uniref:Terpene synthase n=1 Tax=Streptosporangium becharense TaxID=1816182 RepID=A0A7W9ILQ1_9ACTN|nr:glutamate dehydrogenase [Streptosporangium becharense]MBB2910322.1 hypothetical protein [Streptosporangium becharense]MBB5823065.1 hypothetical protein [Streptosporangium becharense]